MILTVKIDRVASPIREHPRVAPESACAPVRERSRAGAGELGRG